MKLLGVIEACTMVCENFITAFSMAFTPCCSSSCDLGSLHC